MNKQKGIPKLDWLNPIKAFALMAILLNHFVEEFGSGPWFTNPSENWPDFATRMSNVFPGDHPFPISLIQFLGWLGDSGPGVFILASGFGLTWSALYRSENELKPLNFYKRRLLRIFPLYITAHFVILALAIFVPGNSLTIASPKTLLSMLGLRFVDGLFFYINPSWWFVWLVLQLYLLFPLLYPLLKRTGPRFFLLITFSFTFLSRFLGIVGVRYSHSLYYWMTGIFFGTRLAEFTAGMALAVYLFKIGQNKNKLPEVKHVFCGALLLYISGLFASFTWPGTIVSNLFVTLGLSGLFYAFWTGWIKRHQFLVGIVSWIGIQSYSIYLIHQTPLKWTAVFTKENPVLHITAALIVLAISFPAAWLMDRIIFYLQKTVNGIIARGHLNLMTWSVGLPLLLALLFTDPRHWEIWRRNGFFLVLGLFLVVLCVFELFSLRNEKLTDLMFRWALIFTTVFQIFLFFSLKAIFSLFIGVFFTITAGVIFNCYRSRILAWFGSFAVLALLVVALEFIFGYFTPLEAGRWGEFPALETHPTRIYSLKPNQVIRLKYNNYDYILRTNSFGLANPEIELKNPASNTLRILAIGDAFTMPEGVEYNYAYPSLLEKKLAAYVGPGNVQVINAGVTGYGPVEESQQLKELGPLLKPDIVIYEFFINEFHEANLTAEDRLKSIGLIRYCSVWQNILNRSQVLANLGQIRSRIKELIRHEPADWRYNKSLLSFYKTGENSLYSNNSLTKVKYYIEEMYWICRELDATFVIYFVPGAVAVSNTADIDYFPWNQDITDKSLYDLNRPLKNLLKITDSLGISVVDLTPHLKSHFRQPVYFPESWHWNKEGHKVVANVIAKDLADRGLLGSRLVRKN